ncbi:MAG: HD domain-containing protein [bacterium]|nr:HD domain-containing protein [bacterium]
MEQNVIPTILQAMEKKDQVTLMHLSKVQQFINLMIPKLTEKNIISEEDIADLWTSAILHDVGKIFIVDDLLKENKPLDQSQMKNIREHSMKGYNFLRLQNISHKILSAVKYHHERWDGKTSGQYPGYPEGLRGFDIPLYARIIQIADSFDAMVAYRPYKGKKSIWCALKEIREYSGTQFDPYISQLFIDSISSCGLSLM